nr:unnamed protein product [Callosobruchus analis]
MSFSLRRVNPGIPCDNHVKFLGVYLDAKLTWEEHIIRLCSKLSSLVYLIRSLSQCLSLPVLLAAYHGYFSSTILNGILIWGHSSHMDRVFRLQRRCIRVMSGLGWRDCCRNKFTELSLLTLPSLYILNCLKHIKANLHRFTYHSDIHDYPSRN